MNKSQAQGEFFTKSLIGFCNIERLDSGEQCNETFSSTALKTNQNFHEQAPQKADGGIVIYGGQQHQKTGDFQLVTVENCGEVINVI